MSNRPRIQSIVVNDSIKPDPLRIEENDVVFWGFKQEKKYDMTQVHNLSQAVNPPHSRLLPPRYYIGMNVDKLICLLILYKFH